jgi:hypothetical protein
MGKFRSYTYKEHHDNDFIIEWVGQFNQEAFLDDQFTINSKYIPYFFDGETWSRGLASPFFYEDVIQTGRIGIAKVHKKVKATRVFLIPKEWIFHDQWSIDYLQKKRIPKISFDVFGEYKINLRDSKLLLLELPNIGFPLGTVSFIEFAKKMNNMIQNGVIAYFLNLENQDDLLQQDKINQSLTKSFSLKFLSFGVELIDFMIKLRPSK